MTARESAHCLHGRPVTGAGYGCPECYRPELDHGRAARDRGLAAAVERPAAQWDLKVVLQAIEHLARQGGEFSADDVRPLLPAVGPQVIGAGFNVASKRGLIEAVGYKTSTTASRHGSVIRVWRGTRADPEGLF